MLSLKTIFYFMHISQTHVNLPGNDNSVNMMKIV